VAQAGPAAVKAAAKEIRDVRRAKTNEGKPTTPKIKKKMTTISDDGKMSVTRRTIEETCEKCGEVVDARQCMAADGRLYCSLACLVSQVVAKPDWAPVEVGVVNTAGTIDGFFSAIDVKVPRLPALLKALRDLQ